MNNPNPELVVLPFQAKIMATSNYLDFHQVTFLVNKGYRSRIQIERSYPGAPETIGWTIFHRTTKSYIHKNDPFFRMERGARRHIRKAYAIFYALNGEDGLTQSHLYL